MGGFDDERGMVGIGTLIVFIAMVITAAVAAGVLIQTSGTLQQQARATAEETITEVSSGVKVLAAKGKTNENSEIDNLSIIVKPYAGSDGINLENLVIQYRSEENAYHLTYEQPDENLDAREDFKVVNLQGDGTLLDDMSDISKIVIAADNLKGSEDASLTFMPSHGFQTYYGLIVPSTLSKSMWYEL